MAYLDSGKVYKIVNINTGKVLDISNDHKKSSKFQVSGFHPCAHSAVSVVGNDFHDGGNQMVLYTCSVQVCIICLTYVLSFKWVLQRRGPMWAIQSIGSPYCLGLDGEPEFHNPVVATCYHTDEYCWWIVADDPTYNPSIYRHVYFFIYS
jgi:hypothetical protein